MGKRDKNGSVIKRGKAIYARVRYVDETGKEKTIERKADNRSHARLICKDLLADLKENGEDYMNAEQMTFAELAAYYKKHYISPARYSGGRKIAGLRSWKSADGILKVLKDYFGRRVIRRITYGDLKNFRAARLDTPTERDRARAKKSETEIVCTRSVASVNRELALLRKIFNVAVAQSWLKRNPFNAGESLISLAAETKRERILTPKEEARLLKACEPNRYKHLRPILIAALDTGARLGELLSLTWRDVDFKREVLSLTTYKDKNMKTREVAFTDRLRETLLELWKRSDKRPETLVFGIKSNVKRSFDAVRRAAGLDRLRFHDLRHSAATRLAQMQIPLSEVGRILGHTTPATTYRYANANIDTARRAAAALNSYNVQEIEVEPMVENQIETMIETTETVQ